MFKLLIIASLCALSASKPGLASVAYHAPLAYNIPYPYAAAPFAHYAAPLAYTAPHVLAYRAPATYAAGAIVEVKSEPLEHHGYEISY